MPRAKTHQEFMSELEQKFPDYRDHFKVIGKYDDNNTPIEIKNKYGVLKIRPRNLLSGVIPTIRTSIDKNSYFENKLFDKYPELSDKLWNFSKYLTAHDIIYFETDHGKCRSTPNALLHGKTPNINSAVNKTDYIISFFRYTRGDKYDYSQIIYTNYRTAVRIICPIHGFFEQTPALHARGHGCPTCGRESIGHRNWIKGCWKARSSTPTLYVIRCWNDNEEFYKVGKTRNSIRKRYPNGLAMPYNFEIIQEIFGTCSQIQFWETQLHSIYHKLNIHYSPKITFAGSVRECYKLTN